MLEPYLVEHDHFDRHTVLLHSADGPLPAFQPDLHHFQSDTMTPPDTDSTPRFHSVASLYSRA